MSKLLFNIFFCIFARRWRLLPLSLAAAMPVLMWSCSLDDPRDNCCTYNYGMNYAYCPYNVDVFPEYIFSLRHYLFNEDGRFMHELPPGENLQYQPISLPEGTYTMITIGNSGFNTHHPTSYGDSISSFALFSTGKYPTAPHLSNSDELYWGVKSFRVDALGRSRGLSRASRQEEAGRMTTYMNNIHCHLRVRVEWTNMPSIIGTYEMELSGVPSGYSLHPESSSEADGFIVPAAHSISSHRIEAPLIGRELNGEFITLRYSDEQIPTLRLWCGEQRVGPEIDLRRAFQKWGWHPSLTHVQNYNLQIIIHSDGSAELSPILKASINDWIYGGTFS